MRKWTPLVPVALFIVGVVGASAQEVLYTLESPYAEEDGFFGVSVSGAGDVDNNGYDDVVVGADAEDGGAPTAGRAYVFSGQTGDLLWLLQSFNAETDGYFGISVSGAGDADNDGYDDVVVGANWEDGGAEKAGRAYIFSAGWLLWALESPNAEADGALGGEVSGAGDVDNDGYDDVVVSAWREDAGEEDAGRAYIFSGQTGTVLCALQSPNAETGGELGAVSGAGDADNDGYDDVVVGAWHEDGGAEDAGRAYIFSGQTGDLLWTLESPNAEVGGEFGLCVAGAGDANNDGYGDVVVGARNEDGGATAAGRAYIFSGQTGSVLWTLESPDPEVGGELGWSVSGAGDVNNDGYDDVVVGAWQEDGGATDAGRAYIFSGQTGGLLWMLESPNVEAYGWFGASVSGAGDVNNDGYEEVVVGASREDGGAERAGRAYVLTLPTSAPDRAGVGSYELALEGPFPNPGDGSVRLTVRVPRDRASPATLGLYDVRGRRIATLLDETAHGGDNLTLSWPVPAELSPGVYWWRLKAGGQETERAMVIAR